ncbi:3-hydroxybutyryl-CoA dehydrogenase [Pseudorhodobacter sp. E13]|nr:3-hydroxybutyryl-CoA dehydrogenase [Pseudorhodobacter sp. E13]
MAVIGVVGLGTMGLGIAQIYAAAGHRVLATDGQAAARETALARMAEGLARRVAAGKLTEGGREATLANLHVQDSTAGLAPCDMVVEAIVETLEAKQALFRDLETLLRPDAVLATNTSALSVTQIAKGLGHPGRVLGLHFFNPAPAMKLVELVTPPRVTDQAAAFAKSLTEAAGKIVIACADRPGFIVNRCARPFYGEALALLEEGHSAAEIDAAMLHAGYRLGPFSLIDLVGADINLAATRSLFEAMGHHPRYHVFESLVAQVAAGRLGVKTGSGFLVGARPTPQQNDAIVLRIEATLVNEAASLLAESSLTPEAVDTALRLGLNFPRGPFESMRQWGVEAIGQTLARLEAQAPAHLRGRYVASPCLASEA